MSLFAFSTVPAPIWLTSLILGYVVLQRLGELWIAQRNTRDLLAAGGREVSASHYPLLVILQAIWLAALFFFSYGQPVTLLVLVLFAVVQVARFWTLATLGRRWTTRIIVMPGERLVTTGPFRFVSHPNYLVVIAELLLLPLVFGLPLLAAIFSALNAAVLTVRISAEERALATYQDALSP